MLQNPGMIFHPPTLFLGYIGFTIPFAYAIAAMISGKLDAAWLRKTRAWTVISWIFLSIGIILGGQWAYVELGWGGYWAWDPVENASFLPWLTGTAYLHSVMLQEKKGMLKIWNIVLIILTFNLCIFGTFITRTGVIGSVHAFSQTALGPVFFVFIGLTFLGSLALLLKQRHTLKTKHELESFISREAAFLLQNLLFLAITFAVFWGTVFPMISELITGTKITVGPPYFKKVTGPLFAVLVLLMAVAPLFAWRRQGAAKLGKSLLWPLAVSVVASAGWAYLHRQHPGSFFSLWLVSFVLLAILLEYWKGVWARMRGQNENLLLALARLVNRNRRRYGGYLVHLGVIMIALGFIGDSLFKAETQATLRVGERVSIGEYDLRFDGLSQYPGSDGREVLEASVSLFKDGEFVRELRPRRDYFVVQRQPVTVPGVYSSLGQDVYVLLVGWEEIGLSASTFKVYLNPLINWTWIGGLVLVFGSIIAMWPVGRGQAEGSYAIKPRELRPKSLLEAEA
jgi:cytochrome c-type biogenesis protein CcmF